MSYRLHPIVENVFQKLSQWKMKVYCIHNKDLFFSSFTFVYVVEAFITLN